jgi:low temperature requirement protein LtrA
VYAVLTVEFFGTLAISMTWRKLSFKATHIGERLGLLGLIIIGEGVIGTSKTIVRMMGKKGPTFDASAQIFYIVLISVCSIMGGLDG